MKDHSQDQDIMSTRKNDHLELVLKAQMEGLPWDQRFYYEPLLSPHPRPFHDGSFDPPMNFLGKKLLAPLWISSMTGGTQEAGKINRHLAQAAAEFGLGMGLGSCRILLESDTYLKDFQLRPIIGKDRPFFANLGLAQVEQALEKSQVHLIHEMVQRLDADGLVVHVNPLQEWLQPEGDRFKLPPLDTLKNYLEEVSSSYKVIVKEVGQGMGPESLRALFQLPLAAVEFSSFGGTNFSQVEMMRGSLEGRKNFAELAYVGHTAEEMIQFARKILHELGPLALCKEFIISGGVKSFLDGHYLMNKLGYPCIYGQGKTFLEHSRTTYEELRTFIQNQIDGLLFARSFLRVRD